MKRIFCKLLVCSCLLLSISCKNETETLNADYGYNYFPFDSGTYVIYRVDSTLYNDFVHPIEVRHVTKYLKEKIYLPRFSILFFHKEITKKLNF